MAMTIRKIANANHVPLFESPQLARSLFAHVEVGDAIPSGLYVAVAQVLAYVFQLKGASVPPERPDPSVPDEFRAGPDGRSTQTSAK